MAISRSSLLMALLLGLLVVDTQGQAFAPSPMAFAPTPMEFPGVDPGFVATGTPYYISYGTLNANRSPCPAGAGRSYYTPNCQAQTGPVSPYARSCNQITRCARG